MRALALLLIIANLGYLGWATLIDAPAKPLPVDSTDTSQLPRLVLATERVPAAVAATQVSPRIVPNKTSDTAVDLSAQKCKSVGPFQDLTTAVEASAALKGAGFDSRQRLEQGELWVGHWVSIGGFATHEQAERALVRLKDKGVLDAYILPGSDPANVISLGVFKEQERAQRRLVEAKALGFDVQITDRTRSGSVYWIDVDLKSSGQGIDTSLLGSQPGKIVRLEVRACPPNAG